MYYYMLYIPVMLKHDYIVSLNMGNTSMGFVVYGVSGNITLFNSRFQF